MVLLGHPMARDNLLGREVGPIERICPARDWEGEPGILSDE